MKKQKPWNKGLKGIHLSKKTEFKKGVTAREKNHFWKGGIQKNKNDCTYLYLGVGLRGRRPRIVYTEHFGQIPKGYVIYHKDGDKDNDDISNLEAISRQELIRRNILNRF